jgi:hypothetical protein
MNKINKQSKERAERSYISKKILSENADLVPKTYKKHRSKADLLNDK